MRPVPGDPWLFISREASHDDGSCQIKYTKENLVGQDIGGFTNLYDKMQYRADGSCFPGAYAYYGSASPQSFVISQTPLSPDNQQDVGLVVHELLHNLGLGHTQKRSDAGDHIVVNWDNIQAGFVGQYEPACSESDPDSNSCSLYNDFGTSYDCMSIMHYR